MAVPVRRRLFFSHLAVLLIGMSLAAGLAWLAGTRLYLANQAENLLAQAQSLAAGLQGAAIPAEPVQPYAQTANVLPGIHTRLLDEQGGVLVGLPLAEGGGLLQAPQAEAGGVITPEELRQRPEIQQALAGQPATQVRRVLAAGGRRVLYAAAPVSGADGQVVGIVYLAAPLPAGGLPAGLAGELLAILLAAGLLAAAAGGLLARRLARPLEALAQAARAVSTGDLEQQAPVNNGVAELDALGEAFNRMTAGLRQAAQARNALLADVTHELRTPLTVIKGTLETLEDGALDDLEGRGPLLRSMQAETERLIRLVNDLLLLGRADAGALGIAIQTLDLAELARGRCRHYAARAAQRGVKLRVVVGAIGQQAAVQALDAGRVEPDGAGAGTAGRLGGETPEDVVLAQGDPDRTAQIVDNLLDNAIRHTAVGSQVTVRVWRLAWQAGRQAGQAWCAVADQGPGIAEEHLPLIFERFYRAEASRSRLSGGSGLGLAIARALTLAQGGQIAVRNTAEGAELAFWLPEAPSPPAALPILGEGSGAAERRG